MTELLQLLNSTIWYIEILVEIKDLNLIVEEGFDVCGSNLLGKTHPKANFMNSNLLTISGSLEMDTLKYQTAVDKGLFGVVPLDKSYKYTVSCAMERLPVSIRKRKGVIL